jgi:pimeloyl-ACP methyl ester carboxylesterase
VSAIFLNNRLLHYEVFGRGQPIIFLHSWVGSWRYWVPTMDLVAEHYRAYAIDFWGFGDSERESGSFTIGEYVECLEAFMREMGLQQAHIVGHGLGGMVALRAVQKYPERVLRLMIVSTPLHGKILSEIAKPGKISRLLGRNNPTSLWSKMIRQIPIDDPDVQQELYEDTDNLSEQVVQQIQESILNTDLQTTLMEINSTPLLAVYGEKDSIVPPQHAEFLHNQHERPQQLIVLPNANHFPFLEQTTTFSRLVMDFIQSEKGQPIEVKEQWRRRVSQREYL